MLSLSLGPLVMSTQHLLLLLALASALLAGSLTGRSRHVNPEHALLGLLLLALSVSRIAFVAAYWTHYEGSALSILDIRDGGFLVWPGLVASLTAAAVYAWRRPVLRKPMAVPLATGLTLWGLGNLTLGALQDDARLPELTVRNAAGQTVRLTDYEGKKLVINLWATWCPPCRREMPVLQAAQRERSDTVFLFVNQRETPDDIHTFLTRQALHLDNMLFDNNGEVARYVGSAALPTTLFYQPDGRFAGSHMGELSTASLMHYLNSLDDTPTASSLQRSTQ